MASEGPDDAGPNLNLTADERQLYGKLFRQADSDNVGIVMGEVAVKFFEKTRLDSRILGEIWQIADAENRGFLTPAGFGIALRLIGHAQAGREPTPGLALQNGPLPRFEGIPPPPGALPLAPNVTGAPGPLSAQGTGSGGVPPLAAQGTGSSRVPPLALDKAAQYAKLFRDQVQGGAILPGDRAKRIFERSGLPNEVLGRIWQLADTEQRGAFTQTEFIIAMHLLTSTKLGTLRALPSVLPVALYEAATRGAAAVASGGAPIPGPASPGRQQSPLGNTPGVPPLPPTIPRQTTGQFRGPPPSIPGGDWLITPAEKARMDPVFDSLDKTKKGFITGEEAVPFLTRSGLSEDVLAQIWDLADVNSEGRLTSDTFAVALYLIQRQRTDATPLPAKLPVNLVPPSMRSQLRPTSPPVVPPLPQKAQVPPPPPPPQPKSALDDLFGLDSGPSSPPRAAALTANVTGPGAMVDPFSGAASPLAPSSPVRASPAVTGSSFKPFVPSSSFGRSLTAQATGDSTGSAPPTFPKMPPPPGPRTVPIAQDDLLGGDNDEASKSISNDTAELANLSNQIGSLSKHMQDVQTHRATLQTDLSQTTSQKKNFEQRLAQLRALYEKEAQDVRGLEEQLTTARTETKKLQTEVAVLEASLQDLQTQQQQAFTELKAEQQESSRLRERMTAATAAVSQLKPLVEKLKSEARQQKGIVAINRKQLSLAEGERDKLKAESEDLSRHNEELSRQAQSGSAPPAVSSMSAAPTVAAAAAMPSAASVGGSPSVASSSGKNPFFRRTGSNDIMGVFGTPRAQSESPQPFASGGDKSFDDVFGPAPTAAPTAAMPGAFQPQTTGASSGSGASSTFTAATALSGHGSTSASRALATDATAAPAVTTEPAGPAAGEAPIAALSAANLSAMEATPTGSTSTAVDVPPAPDTVVSTAETASKTQPTGSGAPTAVEKVVWGHAHNDSISDPFYTLDQQQDSKAKEDFESAFASFKAGKSTSASGGGSGSFLGDEAGAVGGASVEVPGSSSGGGAKSVSGDSAQGEAPKAVSAFSSEFPPISELERDDDSDSDSEGGGGGFDDDFAPASPPKANDKASAGMATPAATATPEPQLPQQKVENKPTAGSLAPGADVFAAGSRGGDAASSATDLDDDFEGLEDAREESADDELGPDGFPSVSFDSSPQHPQSQQSSTAFGLDNSFDFGNLGGSVTAAAGGGTKAGNDWFASLTETTDKTEGGAAAAPAAPGSSGGGSDARPGAPGRLLTDDGEHDDPLLKKLTSMGYSRSVALAALEKYDYNVDRAANHLANQS